MRLPGQNATPLARAAILAKFIPAAANPRLDHGIDSLSLSDLVVCQRPPSSHLLCKYSPGHLLWRLNSNAFPYTIWVHSAGRRLLRHYDLLSLAACRSAAALKDASV